MCRKTKIRRHRSFGKVPYDENQEAQQSGKPAWDPVVKPSMILILIIWAGLLTMTVGAASTAYGEDTCPEGFAKARNDLLGVTLCYGIEDQWMSGAAGFIGDRPLSQVIIPGTHDTLTAGLIDILPFAQTQSLYVDEMLNHGIRWFDIRFCLGNKDDPNSWVGCHFVNDFTNPIFNVVNQIKSFTRSPGHEKEIIVLKWTRAIGPPSAQAMDVLCGEFINNFHDIMIPRFLEQDNCTDVSNPDQADDDKDGIGNACDANFNLEPYEWVCQDEDCEQVFYDEDKDGAIDGDDNCRSRPNRDQSDANQDGVGDACEENSDRDGDGVYTFVAQDGRTTLNEIWSSPGKERIIWWPKDHCDGYLKRNPGFEALAWKGLVKEGGYANSPELEKIKASVAKTLNRPYDITVLHNTQAQQTGYVLPIQGAIDVGLPVQSTILMWFNQNGHQVRHNIHLVRKNIDRRAKFL
jgi:hypothetical protein